ncbi:hypothetical protein MLD38_022185 [Melastoma candidum]|uniref:Uncharacterized protein n=1 Tax=Melastoma candidum TaxID=119954 RepID=A0ACB9QRK1_9MYRT|nr:hypothetical protein MLD38_022185 [Melastoma candidum]
MSFLNFFSWNSTAFSPTLFLQDEVKGLAMFSIPSYWQPDAEFKIKKLPIRVLSDDTSLSFPGHGESASFRAFQLLKFTDTYRSFLCHLI